MKMKKMKKINRIIAIETYRILKIMKYLFNNYKLSLVTKSKTTLNYILSLLKYLSKGPYMKTLKKGYKNDIFISNYELYAKTIES